MTPEELEQHRISMEVLDRAIARQALEHKIEYENAMLNLELRRQALEEFKYGVGRSPQSYSMP